ncbi:hypothetical protein ABTP68_19510, partial [Acinetobacter baumannii]
RRRVRRRQRYREDAQGDGGGLCPLTTALVPAGRTGTQLSGSGNRRLALASVNHFRNIASVSIISVKPAWLIFTVETIDGGPDSVWPWRIW